MSEYTKKYTSGKSFQFACLILFGVLFITSLVFHALKSDSDSESVPASTFEKKAVKAHRGGEFLRFLSPPKEGNTKKSLTVSRLSEWLSIICKHPTREELRALLENPEVTLEQRLGVAWLDKSLLYESLGDQDLNTLTLEAALSLSDPSKNLAEYKAALLDLQPETANSNLILASHFLKAGDADGANELLKNLPPNAEIGGNAGHRDAIQAALVGIGRDLTSAKYYASFAAPTPTGIIELIPELFDIKTGRVGTEIHVGPEDLKTIVPSVIALLQSSSSGNQLSVMDEGLGLEFETALLNFADQQKISINNSGIGYAEAKKQIAEEAAQLTEALPSLFNDQAVFESLQRHGLVADYIDVKNKFGSAAAYKWLKEAAPSAATELNPVMSSSPWTIK